MGLGWGQSSARSRLSLARIPHGMWGEEASWLDVGRRVCMSMCCLTALQEQQPGKQSPARGPGRSSTALWNTCSATGSSLETLSKKSACCLFLLHSEKQDSEYMLCK